MEFSLSLARTARDPSYCIYPDQLQIRNQEDLNKASRFDHVGGLFRKNRRSKETFLKSDVIGLDCDNDCNESNWIYPEDLEEIFGFDVS